MRQFISDDFPDKDGILVVKGKSFRYFTKVLRFKVGDMVTVRLPDGELVDTTLAFVGNDEIKLSLVSKMTKKRTLVSKDPSTLLGMTERNDCHVEREHPCHTERELPCHTEREHPCHVELENPCHVEHSRDIFLFQFQPKSAKFDQIIRQATECGVKFIIPVIGEFSQHFEKNEKKSRSERFSRIIKEARQQSGSPVATEVLNPMTLNEAINYWKESAENKKRGGIVLYERNELSCSMVEAVNKIGEVEIVGLVVGGEGGISPNEIKILVENDFKVVHFETNILRCETAALYGIASLQTLLTEKDKWLLKE